MNATMVQDTDLREKIRAVTSRLDSMESRVKVVETATAAVSKLEKDLAKVISRVEKVESRVESTGKPTPLQETPEEAPKLGSARTSLPPVKAFVSGVSLGLLIIGLVAAAWLLGLL